MPKTGKDGIEYAGDEREAEKSPVEQYVDGGQVGMTFGEALTGLAVREFESVEPEDEGAKGKGSVGKTPATRKVQGNVFVTVVTVRFNVQVDIKG